MDINAVPTRLDNQNGPTVPVEEEKSSSSALASDFETFLRLLTTQLQNQDPSKPLDSTEFVAQLASFSAVEQQINTNTKLDQLITQVNGGMTADLSRWIGTNVKSNAPANFDGTPIDVFYSIPQSATSAQLIVKDHLGIEVDRRNVDVNSTEFAWDGMDSSLNALPNGNYMFEIDAVENAKSLGVQPAQTFSSVIEARMSEGAISLIFSDGSKISASEVAAVRGG